MSHVVTLKAALVSVLCAMLIAASLVGCGGPTRSYRDFGLAQISGTVTMDGKPLPKAQVQFEHENRSYSYGVTNEQGKYTLLFDSMTKGALPGKKTVRIWTTKRGADFDRLMQGGYASTETVPSQYNHESTLVVDIVKGKSSTFDFDLSSKGTTKNAESEGG